MNNLLDWFAKYPGFAALTALMALTQLPLGPLGISGPLVLGAALTVIVLAKPENLQLARALILPTRREDSRTKPDLPLLPRIN